MTSEKCRKTALGLRCARMQMGIKITYVGGKKKVQMCRGDFPYIYTTASTLVSCNHLCREHHIQDFKHSFLLIHVSRLQQGCDDVAAVFINSEGW